MALRADQLLMLGVVGLGVYAVYRMQRVTPKPINPDDIPILNPNGQVPFGDRVPNLATEPTIRMAADQWYSGRLDLPVGVARPGPPGSIQLSASATREMIEQELRQFGFNPVQVFMSPTEAQGHIPLPGALAAATEGSRWFSGRWSPALMPDQLPRTRVSRPMFLSLLWYTTNPTRQNGPQFGRSPRLAYPFTYYTASPYDRRW